jgi:hypothetical protein
VAVIVSVLGLVAITVALLVSGPDAQHRAASAAGQALEQRVATLTDGDTIDLATAVGGSWQRVLIVDAYRRGDEMNQMLGFAWFDAGDWSTGDESQHRLLFIADEIVVADATASPDTFRLDDSITAIEPTAARLVASRGADGVVVLRRPSS